MKSTVNWCVMDEQAPEISNGFIMEAIGRAALLPAVSLDIRNRLKIAITSAFKDDIRYPEDDTENSKVLTKKSQWTTFKQIMSPLMNQSSLSIKRPSLFSAASLKNDRSASLIRHSTSCILCCYVLRPFITDWCLVGQWMNSDQEGLSGWQELIRSRPYHHLAGLVAIDVISYFGDATKVPLIVQVYYHHVYMCNTL
jgi:hypothetical protein